MKRKPKAPPRNRELGLIHILKSKLGMTDDQYRAVLWTQARVDSAKDLDEHGRHAVIKHLQAHLDARDRRYPQRPHNVDSDRRHELKKIEALLTDAGLPWGYAEAVMRRQTRQTQLAWCSAGELAGIIAALEKAALKRLRGELQQLWGDGWATHAQAVAVLLFGFEETRTIERYTEPMSRVLRWWKGELQASCAWPVDPAAPQCCAWCWQRAGLSA